MEEKSHRPGKALKRLATALLTTASLPAFAVTWQPLTVNDFGTAARQGKPLPASASIAGTTSTFELRRQQSSQRGTEHWRYQQYWQGMPVWGEVVDVHKRGSRGTFVRGRMAVEMPDRRNAAASQISALQQAQKAFAKVHGKKDNHWTFSDTRMEQVWYIKDDQAIEAWSVYFRADADGHLPVRYNALMEVQTGQVLKQWNGLAHADATGPGGNEKTGQYHYGTDYPFLQVTKNGDVCEMRNADVITINMNHQTSGGEVHTFTCPENTWKPVNGAFSPLNDAHFFGNATFSMFQDWLGQPPLTFPLLLNVHFDTGFENAFWDGSSMTFGDGADTFYPLVDANVVSHEVAHGYTEQNSGLIYADESGGINEAYSDMAGEALEFYLHGSVDWKVGASIFKAPDGALRYFENPAQDGFSINHASGYYSGMDVHYSSGVFNRAFFLTSTTAGWDPRKAFEVFSHANRHYWQPAATFATAACDAIVAADDLGLDWNVVNNAFVQVGIACEDLPIDSDNDGLPDNWETNNDLDPLNPADAALDSDGDGLINSDEHHHHTRANDPDSDDDGLNDGSEVLTHGTDPNLADTDADRMPDGWELQYGLNPLDLADANSDLDGDGTSNVAEFQFGSDPADPASEPRSEAFYSESFESGTPGRWLEISGVAPWMVSSDFATDGSRSLRSGVIGHNSSSATELNLFTTRGELRFDAGVSSESGFDIATIELDGVVIAYFSGEHQESFRLNLEEGIHTLRLTYEKDGSLVGGKDAAWIDNVTFNEAVMADTDGDGLPDEWESANGLDPADASDAHRDGDNDGLDNLAEYAAGTRPNDSDSDDDGLNDGDEVALGSNPGEADTDQDGMPDGWETAMGLDVFNNDAALDLDGDRVRNIDEFYFGSAANDASSRPRPLARYLESFERNSTGRWQAIDNHPWQLSEAGRTAGRFGLLSPDIGDNESSGMEARLYTMAGTLTFDYGISSEEGFDLLQIRVDDVLVMAASGNQSGQFSMALNRGAHHIKVVYVKDHIYSEGNDNAWIDNVRFSR